MPFASLVLAAGALQEPAAARNEPFHGETQETPLHARWEGGPRWESADGEIRIRLRGRIHLDFAEHGSDPGLEAAVGPLEEGAAFRRARLGFQGRLASDLAFDARFEFAGGDPEINQAFLRFLEVPLADEIRVGKLRESFGIERSTSTNDLLFLERSLPTALAPGKNMGLQLIATPWQGGRWFLGVFRDVDSAGVAQGDGEMAISTRLTAAPWRDEQDGKLLHLGVSASHRNPGDDALRYGARPETFFGPEFVDTGVIPAGAADVVGAEAAFRSGPATIQAEWMGSAVRSAAAGDPWFQGWSLQGAWVLSGEERPFHRGRAAFSGIEPAAPLSRGGGAWEAAVRYSRLDLSDSGVAGGELDDLSLGLNWYPGAGTRVMANYVLADLDGVGRTGIFQLRFQLAF